MPSKWKVPVTSSWATKLPKAFVRIGISRGPQRGQSGYRMYRPARPRPVVSNCGGKGVSSALHGAAGQDPAQVLTDLAELAARATPLCCASSDRHLIRTGAHRGLVAGWLKDTLGLDVFEFGHEGEGAGWCHPKLGPFRHA